MRYLRNRVLLVAAAVLAAACGQESPAPQETAPGVAGAAPKARAVENAEVPPPGDLAQKRPGRGWSRDPLINTFHAALEGVELTDAQRARIDELQQNTGDDAASRLRAAKQALYGALAGAVESGEVDERAFESQLAAVKEAADAKREQRMEMVAALHEMLTPDQRKTVAEAARSWLNADAECPFAGKGGGHRRGPRGPHRMKGSGGPGCPYAGDGDCPHHAGGPNGTGCPYADDGDCPYAGKGWHRGDDLDRLIRGIDLTPDQQTDVDALAAPPSDPSDRTALMEERHRHLRDLFDAFEKDALDPAVLESPGPGHGERIDQLKHTVSRIAKLAEILDDGQRKLLSSRLRDEAAGTPQKRDR
jgi:Spy/CpxP family protein refolding chaperone